ncbi:MAG: DUF1816 domain-containing protein [Cyanobacteria bacterium P01_G01_bin.54]
MKEIWLTLMEAMGQAYWVEVKTSVPAYTYYFGPFLTEQEALAARPGYVEDLTEEGAEGIETQIRQMRPTALTIDNSSGESIDHGVSPVLRGQASGQ